MQAGREIRVMVAARRARRRRGGRCSSHAIAREIEKELEYPGQIKVTVIRESRAVDYAKMSLLAKLRRRPRQADAIARWTSEVETARGPAGAPGRRAPSITQPMPSPSTSSGRVAAGWTAGASSPSAAG